LWQSPPDKKGKHSNLQKVEALFRPLHDGHYEKNRQAEEARQHCPATSRQRRSLAPHKKHESQDQHNAGSADAGPKQAVIA
jgi:hypothetical protein